MLAIIGVIASIIAITLASRRATRWSKFKKIPVGVLLLVPSIAALGVIKLWVDASHDHQLSPEYVGAYVVAQLMTIGLSYMGYVAVFHYLGGPRDVKRRNVGIQDISVGWWLSGILVGTGLIGRAAWMLSSTQTIGASVILDLVAVAGIVCLVLTFWTWRDRKKQDDRLRMAKDELRNTASPGS